MASGYYVFSFLLGKKQFERSSFVFHVHYHSKLCFLFLMLLKEVSSLTKAAFI